MALLPPIGALRDGTHLSLTETGIGVTTTAATGSAARTVMRVEGGARGM